MKTALQPKARAEVASLFKGAGLPLTVQRLAIYERLAASHDHPSAETLYKSLKPRYPSLSLATVYKTLQTLGKLGLVQEVHSPSNQARYDALTGVHHHAVCSDCGKIEDVFARELDALRCSLPAGFRPQGHSVHFHGLCAACSKRPK
ncbi:MAG: transcriptional repressor [Elusimicrobiota bacterium]